MRPLKLRFVAEMPTSPSSSVPSPQSNARPTTGRQGDRSSVKKRLPMSKYFSLLLNFTRCRGHIEFHVVSDLLTFENSCRFGEVFESAVYA